MGSKKDVTGLRQGRLVALDNGSPKVNCLCNCGTSKLINRNHFMSGNIVSCGCYKKEVITERNSSHDLSNSRLYSIWSNMKSRCFNENVDCYPSYGGRGITVETEWLSFEGFISNLPDGYADNLELDRVNNDGNYCKGNCRWTTRSVQCFNKHTENKGVTYSVRDNLWRSKITCKGKSYQKYFKHKEDATIWREAKELELFGFNV